METVKKMISDIKEITQLNSTFPLSKDLIINQNEKNACEVFVTLTAPSNSFYDSKRINLLISFPINYPIEPPKVTCLTKIFHPNISNDGRICVDLLERSWKPIYNLRIILMAIQTLLVAPNPHSPLNVDAAEMMIYEPDKFIKMAKMM